MASSIYTTGQQPKFTGFTQASGDLSLLSKTPEEKLNTFGWKVTTNEEQFSTKTLIGNWNEERFDVKELRRRKPLPSQVSLIYHERVFQMPCIKDFTYKCAFTILWHVNDI